MTENQNTIISQVLSQLKPGEIVDETNLNKYIDVFSTLNPISPVEKEEIIKDLHSRLAVRMDRGVCLKEKKHISWYYTAKKDITFDFWERYRIFLRNNQGFNNDIINALDSSTDEMMDMLGNPNIDMDYSRCGLVIGDVQSGKTSTYTALINKAVDCGYKVIILLTGTIEKLRRQTQGRLDMGFIGLDSTALIRDKNDVKVGVGLIKPSVSGWAVTSTSRDFNADAARHLVGQLCNISTPVLFVVKKNKSILNMLEQWLRLYNANSQDKKIHIPMLLIDDEADNASINTKNEDEAPSVINSCIRKILKLFTRSNYVAFTATPYANIFINPDTQDTMLGDELFPRDFIYALEAPTNYIGARSVFPPSGNHNYMLKTIKDCEQFIPLSHKRDFIPIALPESMKVALRSFFIANAVRDLRGDVTAHRSMLINVSRFIDVQNRLSKLIEEYVREMQREIKHYCKMGNSALKHERIADIQKTFYEYFASCAHSENNLGKEITWEKVQAALPGSVASIVVRSVNGGNAQRNLNYDECENDGLRLIAVGGYSLSRGLTLEGLCISYFYRNSQMYDTLMQMGRWFGYRRYYDDLCQIWMSNSSADWYKYISEVSDELRYEVKKMLDAGLSPKYFGLRVRSDKNSLLVTALNKMRYTKKLEMSVSLEGTVVETPYLHMNKEINAQNRTLVSKWIKNLHSQGYVYADTTKLALSKPQILNVPKENIIALLGAFRSHYLNIDFVSSELVKMFEKYDENIFSSWDILIATGSGTPVDFGDNLICPIVRSFIVKQQEGAMQISGKNTRLGSATDGKGGLTEVQKNLIEAHIRDRRHFVGNISSAFSQADYFNSGVFRKPLLTIYPVQLKTENHQKGKIRPDDETQSLIKDATSLFIGLSIGIPSIEGQSRKAYTYRINLVKWREVMGIDDDYSEDVDDEENSL